MLLALFVSLAAASVSGRVVDAQTHSPVAGVRVVLVPDRNVTVPSAEALEAISDAEGHFVFGAVAPGTYHLDALRKGFAPLLNPTSTSAVIEVADNPVEGLELALTTGATISGRIVEATGTPRPHLI